MKEISLETVLNRTETIEVSKNYNYIEQDAINDKPSIIAGNENLKRYPLTIKLHHSWCNPQSVIDEIDEKAQNREVINYFQRGKYIGDYVIDSYTVNVSQMIDDVITYAELSLNLLENPDSITEFEQQTVITPEISLPEIAEETPKMKGFLERIKESMKIKLFDLTLQTIRSGDITGLTYKGKFVLDNLTLQIMDEIKSEGLPKAEEIVESYAEGLGQSKDLSETDKEIIKRELENIPKTMYTVAIRG